MKRNIILNYIGAAGLMLAACACGKEIEATSEDGNNLADALPEGTFVVDYTVSDGETSRAFEGGLLANERIGSLLYLLYDSEGELVKERVIPGIGESTVWPLERETMSWEQREALKDTLNAGSAYTAVFLANVEKSLFGDTQTDELLQDKDYLNTAKLYLPQTPFTDSNMYYLWKEELSYAKPEGGSDDSRDNPLSMNITLKRLVSRIDMQRIEIANEYDAVKAGMATNFDALLTDRLNGTLDDKAKILESQVNVTEANCDALLGLLQAKIGAKGADNTIAGDNYEEYIDKLVENFKTISDYDLLVTPWTDFTSSSLGLDAMDNCMSLNDLTFSNEESASLSYSYPVTGGLATWIGFACSGMGEITLQKADGTSLELTFDAQSPTVGKNDKAVYTCNPIGNISYNTAYMGEDYSVSVNMSTYFAGHSSWRDLLTAENGFLFDEDGNTQSAFAAALQTVFGNFDDVTLTISVPSANDFTYTTTVEINN